jgi:hypothetical protein
MKNFKTLLLLFAVVIVGLTSCRKNGPDEDATPKVENQAQIEAKAKIMGKWNITNATYTRTEGGVTGGTTNYDLSTNGFFFDFKADNKVDINFKTLVGLYDFSFSADGTTFTAVKTGATTVVSVVKQNTSTNLVLERTHVISTGTEKEVIYLQKQ